MTSWDVWIQSDKARLTQATREELGLKTMWNERPRLPGSTGSAGLRDPPPALPRPLPALLGKAQLKTVPRNAWTTPQSRMQSVVSQQIHWPHLAFLLGWADLCNNQTHLGGQWGSKGVCLVDDYFLHLINPSKSEGTSLLISNRHRLALLAYKNDSF